jgi:hypothetical protein
VASRPSKDRSSEPRRWWKALSCALAAYTARAAARIRRRARRAVHVDAAAYAALLAIDHGEAGAFNAADPNDEVSTEKARAALGWRADFRMDAGLGRRYSTRSSRLFPAAAGHNRRHRDGPFGFPWILSSRDLSVDYTGKTAEIFFPRLLPEVSRAGGASTVLAWGSAGSLMTLA